MVVADASFGPFPKIAALSDLVHYYPAVRSCSALLRFVPAALMFHAIRIYGYTPPLVFPSGKIWN